MLIKHRKLPNEAPLDPKLPPILDRLLRLRGVQDANEVSTKASHLLHFKDLKGIFAAAQLLRDAVINNQTICIVGDFDADGATSTALCMLSLRDLGHQPDKLRYIVPNRFDFGYGLTPPVVDMAHQQGADLIMTVDNGISSVEGVAHAKAKGIKVLISDHHLAPKEVPQADAIVNPNQADCSFKSKHIAGVGVAFYVMSALKHALNEAGYFAERHLSEPNLAQYLDLVALGTVADVVPLDHNNRILVHQGLQRIRAGKTRPGIQALLDVASRKAHRLASSDLGFVLGPRLNAAGRISDMSVGIECLISESYEHAYSLATQLDALNRERRSIEQQMQLRAQEALESISLDENTLPAAIVLFDEDFHQGVVGILAGRIKEKYFRPTIAFALENETQADSPDAVLKGSARSIPGVHIRDVLERVHSLYPGLINKFGGHAMAAGLSLPRASLDDFEKAFLQCADEAMRGLPSAQTLMSDGPLDTNELQLETAQLLKMSMPWGQQFEEPLFDDVFEIIQQRIVGEKHLKLIVKKDEQVFDAIAFNVDLTVWPDKQIPRVHLAYRLDVNEYQNQVSVQLLVSDLAPC
uniref:single-stranded-DNA-specific exonuclease RecJ n=1 Tax=Ningiella ruwaisensis TaxID=2364274 RepID=UPI0010A006E3|nr:single-stranded-DNA-specific exonuclease RecJ [Ningiella ruwaisensis]